MSGDTQPRRTLFGSSRKKRFFRLGNPVLQVFAFFVFAVTLVAEMSVNLDIGSPNLTQDTVGSPAPAAVKATRDFTYEELDLRATEQKRAKAAASIPSTYDFRINLKEQTIERIHKAFRDVRPATEEAEREIRKELGAVAPVKTDSGTGAPETPPSESAGRTSADESKSQAAIREARLRAAVEIRDRFDLALQTVIASDHFSALAEAGFPSNAEKALVALVDDIMRRRLVQDRRLLVAEGAKGIRLRQVRGDEVENQWRILEFGPAFLDIRDVSQELSNQAPEKLSGISDPRVRTAIVSIAVQLVAPNTSFNYEETDAQRNEARNQVDDLSQ